MKIPSYRIATIQINKVCEKISNGKIAFLGLDNSVIVSCSLKENSLSLLAFHVSSTARNSKKLRK